MLWRASKDLMLDKEGSGRAWNCIWEYPLCYTEIGGVGICSLLQALSLLANMVVPFSKERPKGENRSPYNPTKSSHTPYTASFLRTLHKTGAQQAGYLRSFAVCTVKNQGKGDTRA